MAAEYKKANPGVEVLVSSAQTTTYQATMRTMLAAGNAPDVLHIWPKLGNPGALWEIAPGGFLEDLSSAPWVSKYPEKIAAITEYDGKTYLMAPYVMALGTHWNEDVLQATGLQKPKTWSEVLPFCDAARAAGKIPFALGLASLPNNQTVLYNLVPSLVYGPDPNYVADLESGKTTFATQPGWVEAMNRQQQMIDRKCFPAEANGLTNSDQVDMLARGDAVGLPAMTNRTQPLRQAGPEVNFSFSVLPSDDPSTQIVALSNAGGAAVFSGAANKAGAIDFVNFLGSTAGLSAYSNAMVGIIPTIDTGEVYTDPVQLFVSEQLKSGRISEFLNQSWPNAKVEQAMFSGVQGVFAGTQTGMQVLEDMDKAFNE